MEYFLLNSIKVMSAMTTTLDVFYDIFLKQNAANAIHTNFGDARRAEA